MIRYVTPSTRMSLKLLTMVLKIIQNGDILVVSSANHLRICTLEIGKNGSVIAVYKPLVAICL